MHRMGELGSYFILFFLVIILFAISWAPVTGYLTVLSSEKIDVMVDEEVMDGFLENDVVRMIIKFKGDTGDFRLRVLGFENKREFKNFFSVRMRKSDLLKLIDSFGNEIESIQLDHQFSTDDEGWYYSRFWEPYTASGEEMEVDYKHKIGVNSARISDLTGKGQTVCVIDTGIDYNHEDLSGKYLGGYDFVNDDSDPMDDHGHGTYVSGIISSVAPGAKIIAAKALGSDGKGYESEIIAAIDYCMENRDEYGISVIVLALSGGSFEGYCDSVLVTKEANLASERGIFVVAASGNGGSDELTAPACGTKVTSVGGTNMGDRIACGTNINPLLDLLAPGTGIASTQLGGGFKTGSGTSVSTAIVAGAAALVLENEPLEPMELEYRFRSTGFLIEHQGTDYPRIDVYNAINNVVTNTPGEQTGEQSERSWEGEYVPQANPCNCDINLDCSGGQFCCKNAECCPCDFSGDEMYICKDCLGNGQSGCDFGTESPLDDACCGSGCPGTECECIHE